jgi:hypothetical protein
VNESILKKHEKERVGKAEFDRSKVKMIQSLPAQLLIPCCRFQNNRMIANKSHNIFREKSIQAKEPH